MDRFSFAGWVLFPNSVSSHVPVSPCESQTGVGCVHAPPPPGHGLTSVEAQPFQLDEPLLMKVLLHPQVAKSVKFYLQCLHEQLAMNHNMAIADFPTIPLKTLHCVWGWRWIHVTFIKVLHRLFIAPDKKRGRQWMWPLLLILKRALINLGLHLGAVTSPHLCHEKTTPPLWYFFRPPDGKKDWMGVALTEGIGMYEIKSSPFVFFSGDIISFMLPQSRCWYEYRSLLMVELLWVSLVLSSTFSSPSHELVPCL